MFSEEERAALALLAPHIESLELLVKAGKVSPSAGFVEAIPQAKSYMLDLAARLMQGKPSE